MVAVGGRHVEEGVVVARLAGRDPGVLARRGDEVAELVVGEPEGEGLAVAAHRALQPEADVGIGLARRGREQQVSDAVGGYERADHGARRPRRGGAAVGAVAVGRRLAGIAGGEQGGVGRLLPREHLVVGDDVGCHGVGV